MICTFDMLIDAVRDAIVLMRPKGIAPWFARVAPLCQGLHDMRLDSLAIGDAQSCYRALETDEAGYFLCVQAEDKLQDWMKANRDRLFVIRMQTPEPLVTLALLERFGTFAAWQCQLKQVLLEGGRYQEMLDASESILGNHMHITDQNLQIVAMTKNLQPDPHEQYTLEALELGHFSEDAVAMFRKAGRPEKWSAQHGIRLQKSAAAEDAAPYYDFYFHFQGVVRLHLIMHTNLVPASPALRDTLQVLIDHLHACMLNDVASGREINMGAARLLIELAKGAAIDEERVRTEFSNAHYPTKGPFRVLVFDYEYSSDEDQLASYSALHLGNAFEEALVAVLDGRALLLTLDSKFSDKRFATSVKTYVNQHECAAGVSDPFSEFEDAKYAFQQADIALAEAKRTSSRTGYTTFHEAFGAWLVSPERRSSELVAYCARTSTPARILADKKNGGADALRMLEVFLEEERRATAAADRLFMHRTTLLYQIKRLEQTFGFDLDDSISRERVYAELKLVRYVNQHHT